MSGRFVLTAELNVQAVNIRDVARTIRRELRDVVVRVRVEADTRDLDRTRTAIERTRRSADEAANSMEAFGRNAGLAAKRFAGFTIATAAIVGLARAITNATREAIDFERELVKISQVTGKTTSDLKSFTAEVTKTATGMGVASSALLTVSRTLAQAGLTAAQTAKAMNILAKTDLAPTFDNLTQTTEGAIAILRQFGNQTKTTINDINNLERQLGAINAVSKKFAVESSDLITAVRRTGGVFKAAGGNLNELIALFTSVRSTTRESAETIATGFRTIFTRIQRVETIDQLKQLGIQLQNAKGQFVGPMEAIRRLSQALKSLDPKDFRFNQIVEQLGGFRQISKVIPLIQQFDVATRAYSVAQRGANSLTSDAQKAQKALQVQISKVKEEFAALVRKVADSESFRTMVDISLKLASAFIKVADALTTVLPQLITLSTLRIGLAIPSFARGLSTPVTRGRGGPINRFATGGVVPGQGSRDTVPAMLTPGEFVIKKSSVKSLGAGNLQNMNERGRGGSIQRFSNGRGVKRQPPMKEGEIRIAGGRKRTGALVMNGGKDGGSQSLDVGIGTAIRDAGTGKKRLNSLIQTKKKKGINVTRVKAATRLYNPSSTFREDFEADVAKPLQQSLETVAARGPRAVRQRPDYKKEIANVLEEQREAVTGSLAEASIRGYTGVFRKGSKKKVWEFKGSETADPGFADLMGQEQYNLFKDTKYADVKNSFSDTARGSLVGKQLKTIAAEGDASGLQLQNRGGFIQRFAAGGTVSPELKIQETLGLLGSRGASFEGKVDRTALARVSSIKSFLEPIRKQLKSKGITGSSKNIGSVAKRIGLSSNVRADVLDDNNRNIKLYKNIYREVFAAAQPRKKGEEGGGGVFAPGKVSARTSKQAEAIINKEVLQVLNDSSLGGTQQRKTLAGNFASEARSAKTAIVEGRKPSRADLARPMGIIFEDLVGKTFGRDIKDIKTLSKSTKERPFDFILDDGERTTLEGLIEGGHPVKYTDAKPSTAAFNRKEIVKKGFNQGLYKGKGQKSIAIKNAMAKEFPEEGTAGRMRGRKRVSRGGAVGFIDGGEVASGGHFSVSSDTMGLGSWQAVKKFAAEIRGGAYPGIKKINFIAGPSGSGKTFQSKKLGAAPLMDFADAATASQLTFELGGNKIDNVLDQIALARKTGGAGIYLSPADEQLDKQRRRRAAKSKVGRGDPLDKRSAKALRSTKRAPKSGDEASMQMLAALQREFPNLQVKKFASGGGVGTDTVPALLTPGEFVINKQSASSIGRGNLERMNSVGKFAAGGAVGKVGRVQRFQSGGSVEKFALLGALIAPVLADLAKFEGALGKTIKMITSWTAQVGVLTALFVSVGNFIATMGSASLESAGADTEEAAASREAAGEGKKTGKAFLFAAIGISFAITKLNKMAEESLKAAEAAKKRGDADAAGKAAADAAMKKQGAFAVQIASLGALLSKALPGPLKLIGYGLSAATAILGVFTDVLGQAAEAKGLAEFDTKVISAGKVFEQSIKSIERSGATGVVAARNRLQALDKLSKDEKRFREGAGDDTFLKEKAQRLTETLGGSEQDFRKSMSGLVNSQIRAGKSFAQIEGSQEFKDGLDLLTKILVASGIDISTAEGQAIVKKARQDTVASLKAESDQKTRMRAAAQAEAAAFEFLRKRVNTLSIGMNALADVAREAKVSLGEMAEIAAFASGSTAVTKRVDKSDVLKGVSNVGDINTFSDAANEAGSLFGAAGQQIATEAINVAKAFKLMPKIVTKLSRGGLAKGASRTAVENAIGRDLDALPPLLREKFINKLVAMTGKLSEGGKLSAKQIQDEVDKLAKEFDGVNELLSKSLKEFNDHINRLGSAFGQLTKLTLMRVNAEADLASAQLKNAKTLAEARGGRLGSGARQAFRSQRQSAILGPDRAMGGNAGAIGNALRRTQKDILNANRALQKFTGAGRIAGALADSYKNQVAAIEKLKERSQRLSAALKDLVSAAQDRASDVKENLDLAKKEREARAGLLKEWTFATNEGRADINRSFAALTQAMNAGDIDAIPDTLRPAVGKILDQFKDVELIPGMTGDRIAKQFQVRVLDKMLKAQGMGGVTQRQIKQIFQSTSKEDRLISQLQRAFADEDNARRQWIAVLGAAETGMLNTIQQMHTDFVNKLNAALAQIQAANQPPPPPPGAPPGGYNPGSMVPGIGYPSGNMQEGWVPGGGPKGPDDDIAVGPSGATWWDKEHEAIMNPKATKKYAPVLRAMNSESYAQKGIVPGGGGDTLKSIGATLGQLERVVNKLDGAIGKLDTALEAIPKIAQIPIKLKPLTDASEKIARAVEGLGDNISENKDAIAGAIVKEIRALGNEFKTQAKRQIDAVLAADGPLSTVIERVGAALVAAIRDSGKEIVEGAMQRGAASAGASASGAVEGVIGKGAISEAVGGAVKSAFSTEQTPEQSGKEAAKNIKNAIDKKPSWLDKFKAYSNAAALGISGGKVAPFATGGSVFTPKGTDTVPAMLTPGEFVVRKSAVDKIGVGALNAINTGYYSGGGVVQYLKNGGGAEPVKDTQLQLAKEHLINSGQFKDLAQIERLTVEDYKKLGLYDLYDAKGNLSQKGKQLSQTKIKVPPRPSWWTTTASTRKAWDDKYGDLPIDPDKGGTHIRNTGIRTDFAAIQQFMDGKGSAKAAISAGQDISSMVGMKDSDIDDIGYEAFRQGKYTGQRDWIDKGLEGTRSLAAGTAKGIAGTVIKAGAGVIDLAAGTDLTSKAVKMEDAIVGKAAKGYEAFENTGRIAGTIALVVGTGGAAAGTAGTVAIGATTGALMGLSEFMETGQAQIRGKSQDLYQAFKGAKAAGGENAEDIKIDPPDQEQLYQNMLVDWRRSGDQWKGGLTAAAIGGLVDAVTFGAAKYVGGSGAVKAVGKWAKAKHIAKGSLKGATVGAGGGAIERLAQNYNLNEFGIGSTPWDKGVMQALLMGGGFGAGFGAIGAKGEFSKASADVKAAPTDAAKLNIIGRFIQRVKNKAKSKIDGPEGEVVTKQEARELAGEARLEADIKSKADAESGVDPVFRAEGESGPLNLKKKLRDLFRDEYQLARDKGFKGKYAEWYSKFRETPRGRQLKNLSKKAFKADTPPAQRQQFVEKHRRSIEKRTLGVQKKRAGAPRAGDDVVPTRRPDQPDPLEVNAQKQVADEQARIQEGLDHLRRSEQAGDPVGRSLYETGGPYTRADWRRVLQYLKDTGKWDGRTASLGDGVTSRSANGRVTPSDWGNVGPDSALNIANQRLVMQRFHGRDASNRLDIRTAATQGRTHPLRVTDVLEAYPGQLQRVSEGLPVDLGPGIPRAQDGGGGYRLGDAPGTGPQARRGSQRRGVGLGEGIERPIGAAPKPVPLSTVDPAVRVRSKPKPASEAAPAPTGRDARETMPLDPVDTSTYKLKSDVAEAADVKIKPADVDDPKVKSEVVEAEASAKKMVDDASDPKLTRKQQREKNKQAIADAEAKVKKYEANIKREGSTPAKKAALKLARQQLFKAKGGWRGKANKLGWLLTGAGAMIQAVGAATGIDIVGSMQRALGQGQAGPPDEGLQADPSDSNFRQATQEAEKKAGVAGESSSSLLTTPIVDAIKGEQAGGSGGTFSASGEALNILSPARIAEIIKGRMGNTPPNKIPKRWRGIFNQIGKGANPEEFFPAVFNSAKTLQGFASKGFIESAGAGAIKFSLNAYSEKDAISEAFPMGAPPLLGSGASGDREFLMYKKGLPEYVRDYMVVARAAMQLQMGNTEETTSGEKTASGGRKDSRKQKGLLAKQQRQVKRVTAIKATLSRLNATRAKLLEKKASTEKIDTRIATVQQRLGVVEERFKLNASVAAGEQIDPFHWSRLFPEAGGFQGPRVFGNVDPLDDPALQEGGRFVRTGIGTEVDEEGHWAAGFHQPANLLGQRVEMRNEEETIPDDPRGRSLMSLQSAQIPYRYATGGSIPSMGSDTVPAMLTPGEFIMSKGAVGKYGTGFMKSLNRGGIQGYNKGGLVQYLQNGSTDGPVKSNGNGGINVDGTGIAEALINQAPVIGNMMGQGIGGSLKPILDNFTSSFAGAVGASGLDAFVAGLSSAATMFNTAASTLNGLEMTCNISFEGPLSLTGIDVPGFADAITAALEDHVKNEVNNQLSKRPNRVTGGK